MTLKNMLYQLKKEVFYRNTLLRKIYTKNYSVKKVAIGETKDHHFPRDWQRVDYSNADYDIDLNSSYVLPFESDTIEMMYSAHCMEHLKEERAQYLLEESYRVMANGGVIRIEVPDVTRIIECYKKRTPEYLDHFDKRYSYMCDNYGYDEKYMSEHVGMMGTISNYFVEGINYQIPVYSTQEECDEKLATLNIDEYCEWCISLQSKDQLESAGHKSYHYFEKIRDVMTKIGFVNVTKVGFNETGHDVMKLNTNKKDSINEKPHRKFYSLYVEGQKLN